MATPPIIRPFRYALSMFRGPSGSLDKALPLLEHAVRLKGGETDYVSKEYLGGAYCMLARKRFADGRDDSDLLKRAVYYFTEAYRTKQDLKGVSMKESVYPQLRYAKPEQLSLRHWGDALAWLGHQEEAELVFNIAKRSGLWKTPWCRPQKKLPLQIFAVKIARAYTFPASSFTDVYKTVAGALPKALEEYEAIEATLNADEPSAAWSLEQAGLHSSRSWWTLPLIVDGSKQEPGCQMMPETCAALYEIPLCGGQKLGK